MNHIVPRRNSQWSMLLAALLMLCFCGPRTEAQCSAPDAVTFTESFGDSSSACWPGGPTGCNQPWKITQGTAYSIVESPPGAPANTACANSLQLAASTTPVKLQTYGSIPAIPAGTNLDLSFSLYVTTAPRDFTTFLQLKSSSTGALLAQMVWRNSGGSTFVYASGSTSSANTETISLASWHSLQLHIDAVAQNSYVTLDGGAQHAFTANAQAVNAVYINGDASGTYLISNLQLNAPGLGPSGNPMLADFAGAVNSIPVTAAAMNAGSHCVNTGWTVDSGASALVFSNDRSENLHTSVQACGNLYHGDTGMSVRFDLSSTQAATYTLSTTSSSASVGFFYNTAVSSRSTTYFCNARITGAFDYACVHQHGNGSTLQMYLEVYTSPELFGAPISISPNTWYWVTLQYNAGGTHHLRVYDTTKWSLIGSSDGPSSHGTDLPIRFDFGHSGSDVAPAGTYLYFANIELDWVTAAFPLGPGSGDLPIAPAITSAKSTTFAPGTSASFTVTATGVPTPALTESGTLPPTISFVPATGVLSGTPTTGDVGSYPIQFMATNSSDTAVQDFTLNVNLGGTAAPTFSPPGGSVSSSQSVSISDATPGAIIYYTTDGSPPSASSTPYAQPIQVSSTTTLNAIALAPGYANSPVTSAIYTLQVPLPTFSPAAGSYTSVQSVTISDAAPASSIYYTTDGSTPTTSSTLFNGPVSVANTTTLMAIATLSGWSNSAVASGTFSIQSAGTPSFTPSGGTYSTAQSVTLSDSTPGAAIYYTTDGSTPTMASTQYAGPIPVSQSTTLNAIASTGGPPSPVASSAYTLRAATPAFSPGAGTYSSAQSVTISDATPGALIYYTTNGVTPTTASTLYSAPVSVSSTATLMAIATLAGWSNSALASASYTISMQAPATPTLSPKSGTYTAAQTVTISDSTTGAAIYYTTDGSTPTTASAHYAGPILVSQSASVKAIASTGGPSSPLASGTYTLRAATPTFSPGGTTYSTAQSVTITDTTPGATIYYTTDGSTPTAASTPYAGPVSVSQKTTIKAIAILGGWSNSASASATYTFKVPSPAFSPGAGNYKGAQTITISDALPGVSIYYTVNGSTPSTSSTPYTGPITVSKSRTLKAIAVFSGWSNSSTASASYTIR
jgi:hypothetical protein